MISQLAQVTVETSSSGFGSAWVLLVNIVFLGIGIWVAVDAYKYSDTVWQSIGQTKMIWVVIPLLVGLCCGIFVLIPVLYYFLSVKKKLDAASGGFGV